MRLRVLFFCLTVWLLTFPLVLVRPAAAQDTAAAAVLEEIVVTARRRAENLENLPLSVAALTAATMRAQGVYNIEQVGELVPNVTLATGERADNTQVFIRGIGGGNPDPTLPFGSGMYIDGHYIPNSVGGYLSTLNIERVEVLRGPQGTLYGKNTTGGAINIISAKPSPDFSSELSFRAGEFGRRDMRGMLNFPVSDDVSARLSAAHEQSDGYYYNRTLDRDDASRRLDAFTGALRFTPGTNWTIDTSLNLARNRDGGIGGQCAPGDEPWSRNRPEWYGDDADQTQTYAICSTDVSLGPFVNSSEKRNFTDVETQAAFFSAKWVSGGQRGALDDLSVTMNASYRNVDFDFMHDRDFNPFAIRAIGMVGDDPPRYTRTRSAELLVEGVVNDRLDFVTGIHYFEDETKNGDGRCFALFNLRFDPANPDADISCAPVTALLFETTPLREQLTGGPTRTRIGEQSAWNTSVGVFGHLTYALNDRWTLEAGLRYTEDTRKFDALEFFVSNVRLPDPTGPAEFDVVMNQQTILEDGVISEGKKTFSETTPVLSLARTLAPGDWLDSGMVYARYSQGFLTGGFNTELPIRQQPLLEPVFAYGPEHVNNYELGFKGTFSDGRWQLNAAVFYMDYTDKQDFVRLDNRDGTLGLGESVNLIWNISQVDIYGLELEARARPWRGGLVELDVGYLRNEYGEYASIDNDFSVIDLSNLAISDLSPDWTLNARVQHTFNLSNGGALTPMLGVYWQSEYEWMGGLERDAPATRCFQDAYAKWRARLTYEPPSRSYEISLFGKNINDERIYERCDQNVGLYLYRYEAPSTWGVEFLARWGE